MNLALFTAVGSLLGGLVATLLGFRGGSPWDEAILLGLPLGFGLAVLCMASRYPARAVPPTTGKLGRVVVTHLSAAVVSSTVWLFLGFVGARILENLPRYPGASDRFVDQMPTLALVAVLIYLLAVTVHYLNLALEAAGELEIKSARSRELAREAELRALRAQVDPHFLFNSLNSIATLATADPAAARRMCLLLAGFMRRSLDLGEREQIPLGEELSLIADYLAVERIRFGERLKVEVEVDEPCRDCPVPPLLLQPLVENAVRHGIAQLVEGGTLRIIVRREADGVAISVSNPRDPELSGGRGAGLGLENVRGRLKALHGGKARIDAQASPADYQVQIFLPWTAAAAAVETAEIPKAEQGALGPCAR